MSARQREEIERFNAITEDGEVFTIIVEQEYVVTDEGQRIPHLKRMYTLQDELTVHHKIWNKYEIILFTGDLLTVTKCGTEGT